MLLSPIKFYDDGANDGAGGNQDDAAAQAAAAAKAAEDAAKQTATPAPIFTNEELTQYGFKTIDEAKAAAVEAFNRKKENAVTEEEKIKAANIENAEMLKYAAENDLLNDDFKKYDSLQSKTDRDLVFNKFASEFKEDNPDIPEDKLEEETKIAFESEYKLSSVNAKEKTRGESRLTKEAKELRSPAENAYTTVKTKFSEYKDTLKKGEGFAKTFKEVVAAIPDKLEVFKTTLKADDKNDKEEGEELIIEVELTKDEKEKIEKDFNTEKTMAAYLRAEKDGKVEEFRKNLSNKILRTIKDSRQETIYSDIAIKAKGFGMKNGSTVGAGQPFSIVKNIADDGGTTPTDREAIMKSTRRTG